MNIINLIKSILDRLGAMNLVFATASQLARAIRDKEVSATEVLTAYLEQIAKHNSKINAIAILDEEKARKEPKKPMKR